MPGRGGGTKRLYCCEECGARRYVHWLELNRAGRPRCSGCGSARLELVSQEGKEEQARLNQERIVGTGGSLHLASDLYKRRRKVT